MSLRTAEIINLILAAVVGGMYWGPWLALSRSFKEFEPALLLVMVRRMGQNMGPLMTFLSPLSLLATVPVLVLAYGSRPGQAFYFALAGWACFGLALVVTMVVEVPIVQQIITWTEATLPANWQVLRDRWGRFHVVRVGAGLAGLLFFLLGAVC